MNKRIIIGLLACLCALENVDARKSRASKEDLVHEQRQGIVQKMKAEEFGKVRRTQPRFTGEFSVGFVFVDFPDTIPIDVDECMKRQTEGVADYFKRYTQAVCWPKCKRLGTVYRAPRPLGYYTRFATLNNRIGWTNEEEGKQRVAQLRKEAIAFSRRNSSASEKIELMAFTYASQCAPLETVGKLSELRSLYKGKVKQSPVEIQQRGIIDYPDQLVFYNPASTIRWGDPLWPNSALTLDAHGSASTLIHELGHVLGAPDTYHAPKVSDGVPGTPITVGGGPTGPLYFRYRYCGLLSDAAYPLIKNSATITLAPRWSTFSDQPLGIFIPTQHPYYLLHLEYEPSQPQKLSGASESEIGRYDATASANGGIYIYLINVTKGDPYQGHPDLCYAYRPNDRMLHGEVDGIAVFREGDRFNDASDPRNLLPNLLPTGVEITFGAQNAEGATVTLTPPQSRLTGTAFKQSLLPIVTLTEVSELLPTSFRAHMTVDFRGEPLLQEYGFVAGPAPHPTLQRGSVFPLYHRDRYDARILGQRPGATLYVRAYARTPLGLVYSTTEEKIVLPKPATVTAVPPLLTDTIDSSNPIVGKNYDRQYQDGYVIGSTSFVSLLKLMSYLRMPLDGGKAKVKALDFTRLHMAPTDDCFPPRLEEFRLAQAFCLEQAKAAGMMENVFTKDFDRQCAKVFRLEMKKKGKEGLVRIDATTLEGQLSRIRDSLLTSVPVLCIRQPTADSFAPYALNSCMIDGFRVQDGALQLHIVYPEGRDRDRPDFQRPTGWYPPETLLDRVDAARLIFFSRATVSGFRP
ncbi:MAG: hypothetical protein RR007_03715 [Kiritimatiellia bacterium]